MQYAGLEYSRECWCAPYLNTLSEPLDASACDYACEGNTTERCGGSLALSLYNLTDAAAESGAVGRRGGWVSGPFGVGAFAVAVAVGVVVVV